MRNCCGTIGAALALASLAQTGTPLLAQQPAARAADAGVTRSAFGQTPDGKAVELFTLRNAHGLELGAISYGAIVTSLRVPDRAGKSDNIVMGHDTLDGYLKAGGYFGAVVGRYANRIAKGRFVLDGRTYSLATNNGPNHLHGGVIGFDKKVWKAEPVSTKDGPAVAFTYVSPDGEEGYPGTLQAKVTYRLSDKNEVIVEYEARTDKPTHVNLSQHSYFNLAGDGARDVLAHEVELDADRYTPVDATLIPTGVLAPVAGTPFDFKKPTTIGARIDQDDAQIKNGKGYDHNFVVNRKGPGLVRAARVQEPSSGRVMEVLTTEPGVQFYTGNFLDGRIVGKAGHVYRHRYGFCLETQHFPDSPNQPAFPSTVLRPGQEYRSTTVWRFSVAR